MQLTSSLVSQYLHYLFPDESSVQTEARATSWTLQFAEGKRQLANYFVHLNQNGQIKAAMYIQHFHDTTYAIQIPTRVIDDINVDVDEGADVSADNLSLLLNEAIQRLRELGASRGEFRLTEKPHLLPIAAGLPDLRFQQVHVRIEFRAPMSNLPSDEGTPFEWIPVSESGRFTLRSAAKILESAGDGDPDWNPDDDNLELLSSYLKDPEFKSNLDCIQIGLINGEPAAIVIAQVITASGWSRITYMGLLPAFRAKGLGAWVHRHGFAMMRKQSGTLYHGGTVRGNRPMEALFRKHGCSEYRTMQEWVIHL